MKKVNALLHNEKMQGNLIILSIFAVIIAVSIITWGK
jgi:fumarate reductase subunit C